MENHSGRKIVNDPIYGFINIPGQLFYDIIQHPYFQRLRRIKQLGLTNYVYPGANHSRFQHALGATHLMNLAIEVLRQKGHFVSEEEKEAAMIAILLHDIGHGPFSHTLEHSFVKNISHEKITEILMSKINDDLDGKLYLGIEIFKNNYHKKFLHTLVSGQLDMDRLDYLSRDSFFTGVSEGVIGADRIIRMLTIAKNDIAVEEKGIYSIEKFLIARRLMYWQVYLHKTVVAVEQMLIKIMELASDLYNTEGLFVPESISYFFKNKIDSTEKFTAETIEYFTSLDDNDIFYAVKLWSKSKNKLLSFLCKGLLNRDLPKLVFSKIPFEQTELEKIRAEVKKKYNFNNKEAEYLVYTDKISNKAYRSSGNEVINILLKNGGISDIADAADISNISTLSETVEKFFLCYPSLKTNKNNLT